MRFLSADYVFPISSNPVKNGVLVIEDDGTVREILDHGRDSAMTKYGISKDKLEMFRGFLCPGFINAHCHLELSHLKGKFIPGRGLPDFLQQVMLQREAPPGEIAEAMQIADAEMVENGIVAVGDISNTNHSFGIKKKSSIHYHTYLELFDLHPDRADKVFDKGRMLLDELKLQGLKGSLVPHAPYTVSQKLLQKIGSFADETQSILCIHNQETGSEDEMFKERKGLLFDFLEHASSFYKDWKPMGMNSLPSVLGHLPALNRIALVHNTFTKQDDITWAQLYSMRLWWCLCPNANLFIENKLPDIPLLIRNSCRLIVGTDSYASNWSLSILDELKRIHSFFPEIDLNTLLKWGTLQGAEFLGLQNNFGSFESGKRPGVNLLLDVNTDERQMTGLTAVKKII